MNRNRWAGAGLVAAGLSSVGLTLLVFTIPRVSVPPLNLAAFVLGSAGLVAAGTGLIVGTRGGFVAHAAGWGVLGGSVLLQLADDVRLLRVGSADAIFAYSAFNVLAFDAVTLVATIGAIGWAAAPTRGGFLVTVRVAGIVLAALTASFILFWMILVGYGRSPHSDEAMAARFALLGLGLAGYVVFAAFASAPAAPRAAPDIREAQPVYIPYGR